jgi:hypothetical protein
MVTTSKFRLIAIKISIKYIIFYTLLIFSLICSVYWYRLSVNNIRDADINDFKLFLASKPYVGFDSTSYSSDLKYFFELFELKSKEGWGNYIWHRNNIWPLWIEYKHRNNLKVHHNYH